MHRCFPFHTNFHKSSLHVHFFFFSFWIYTLFGTYKYRWVCGIVVPQHRVHDGTECICIGCVVPSAQSLKYVVIFATLHPYARTISRSYVYKLKWYTYSLFLFFPLPLHGSIIFLGGGKYFQHAKPLRFSFPWNNLAQALSGSKIST